MSDPRLHDIISYLATGESVKATDLFKEMLEQRIEDGVRTFAQEYQISAASPNEGE